MSVIQLITTGGTIAGAADANGAIRPVRGGDDILAYAGSPAGVRIAVRDLMSVDSASMTFTELDAIVGAVHDALATPAVDAVIVLHGTDTVEETAMLADLQHTDPRPVFFVGALRPADHPEADGPRNLRAAIDLAVDRTLAGRGVYVVADGVAHPALGTRKVHTTALAAFAHSALPRRTMVPRAIAGTRVDVVALYAGADRVAIDAFVAAGADGLVLESMGAGNANPAIVAAVREYAERLPVVVSTRVQAGPVAPIYSGGGGGVDLVAAGAIVSPHLRPSQARILLAALLAGGADRDEIRSWFMTHTETALASAP